MRLASFQPINHELKRNISVKSLSPKLKKANA